jgi:4-hydroxy-3-polyprenylbenzoate decarboxylase
VPVEVVCSETGLRVLEYEGQSDCLSLAEKIHSNSDLFAPPASGSLAYAGVAYAGMAILPCSVGTLAQVANGMAPTLLTRAASVCLKERRPLVLAVREMPFDAIQLANMLNLTRAGAVVCAASPAFYGRPRTLEDLADTVVEKVMAHLGINL